MSCPFANILGKPGSGFHSWRLGPGQGIAVGDTIATIIAAILTSYIFGWPLLYSLIGWFVTGEVAHWVFGTPTAVLVALGLARRCSST